MTSQFFLNAPELAASGASLNPTSVMTEDLPSPEVEKGYVWQDAVWMSRRAQAKPATSPLSIYRLFPSAWRLDSQGEPLNWRRLAAELIPYVADLGFTHIELKDVNDHAVDHEFAHFVDRCHEGGIGVILEWPPASTDPQRQSRLADDPIRQVLGYLEGFHLDGLRLALHRAGKPGEPVLSGEALQALLKAISTRYPTVLLLSDPGPRAIGADGPSFSRALAWNSAWPYRTLAYLSEPPEARGACHDLLVEGLTNAFDEHYVLPLVDDESGEGRDTWLGRMPGDEWQRFATLRACLGFMWAHPGKKLLGMGTELAQGRGWHQAGELDWRLLGEGFNMGVFRLVADLNRIYVTEPALHIRDRTPDSFAWVVVDDSANSVFAFLRYGDRGMAPLLAIVNFTPNVHHEYRLGVPALGIWREILNSDSEFYGGSNVGNTVGVRAEQIRSHGYPASLSLTIPPLATLLLRQGDWPS